MDARALRLLAVSVVSLGLVVLYVVPSAAASEAAFGAAQRISSADTASVPYAQAAIALDNAGDAAAVWQSNGTIYGSRRPSGGTWSVPIALTTTHISEPNVAALAEDGSLYFDVGSDAPDGDGIYIWKQDGSVVETSVFEEYANAHVAADTDGDVLAYTETANGSTTYHFAAGGTDVASSGWTSATPLPAFGSSRTAFGAGHSYYVAYPPDPTGRDRRFRVDLVDGSTGHVTQLLRRRLCTTGRLAGYDIGAGRSGAAVLTWRCVTRISDVIDVQRIHPDHGLGVVVAIGRSRRSGVTDRLSSPRVAFAPGAPTVIFSRAVSADTRDILATSPDTSGRWRRPSVKARNVSARSAAALGLQLDAIRTGAALLTYRGGGPNGALFASRRMPGAAFDAPQRVFMHSAPTKSGAVAADGAAVVVQMTTDGRYISRSASAN